MAKAKANFPNGRTSSEHPFFSKLKNERVIEFIDRIQSEVNELVNELIDTTPIDTGAAAGTKSNSVGSAKRPIYPKHPAFGMGGVKNLGWSYTVKRGRNQNYEFSIINPMWDAYLQYVEHLHPTDAGFVVRAYGKHRQRVGAGLQHSAGAIKFKNTSTASYNPYGA